MAVTKIADVIVPERFANYVQILTAQKSALIQSGAVVMDPMLSGMLAGGGSTVQLPAWRDLADDADNVSSDDDTTTATANKIQSVQQTVARLSRNGAWSDMDLASELAGSDAGAAIAGRVAYWWTRKQQAVFVAAWTGCYADNAAAASGGDTHTQNDMTNDISAAGSYTAGVTDFSAEAFLDALQTLGDASGGVSMVMMHSVVATRAKKNNLIDYVPDSEGNIQLRTYLGHIVIIDDALPNAANVYDTWIFGPASTRMGTAAPEVAAEVYRLPLSGNGGGQDTIISRQVFAMHPEGNSYIGTASLGGPANSVIDDAASWSRRVPERKQVKACRLITTEA